jgi:hypothetical protein
MAGCRHLTFLLAACGGVVAVHGARLEAFDTALDGLNEARHDEAQAIHLEALTGVNVALAEHHDARKMYAMMLSCERL